jgi:Flp pilus assembly protein TadD
MLRERLLWLAALMILALPAARGAQGVVTKVGGTVRNTTGAFLAGATVTLTRGLSEPSLSAVTDHNGVYTISSVPSGIYTVRVTCRGYENVSRENISVRGSHSEVLNFVMRSKAAGSLPAATSSTLGGVEFYEGTEFKPAPLADPTSGGGHSNPASPEYQKYPPSPRATGIRIQPGPKVVSTEADFERSGTVLLAERDFSGAIRLFNRAVLRYPRDTDLHLQLGLALCGVRRYDSGLRQFSEAARLDPDNSRAYVLLAEVESLTLRRQAETTTLLRNYIARHPDDAKSHYVAAVDWWVSFRAEGSPKALPQAQGEFEKAVEIDPAFARTHLRLGMVYDELHLPQRAVDQYRKAIQLSPNLAAAHYRLAQDERRAGATEDAREQLNVYRKLIQARGHGDVLEDTLEK